MILLGVFRSSKAWIYKRILWFNAVIRIDFILGLIVGAACYYIVLSGNDCSAFSASVAYQVQSSIINQQLHSSSKWFQNVINSDFNPTIKLPFVNQSARSVNAVKRPRFYSDELVIKDQLFIVVITSLHTFKTLGILINQTLAPLADRTEFFLPESPDAQSLIHLDLLTEAYHDLHLINTKKDQEVKKISDVHSTLMEYILQYLNGTKDADQERPLIECYKFFLFIKDNTYVRGSKLKEAMKQLSPSSSGHDLCLGQKFDIQSGLLLNYQIFNSCNFQVDCMKRYCSKQLEALNFPSEDDLLKMSPTSFLKAIVLYPFSTAKVYLNIHHMYLLYDLDKTQQAITILEKEIIQYQAKFATPSWPPGTRPENRRRNRFDVINWVLYKQDDVFLPDDYEVSRKINARERIDLENTRGLAESWLRSKIEVKHLKFDAIYSRFDPSRGMDYQLDVSVTEKAKQNPSLVRVKITKPLNEPKIVSQAPIPNNRLRIIIVVPVRSIEETNQVVGLMKQFMNLCHQQAFPQAQLLVAILQNKENQSQSSQDNRYSQIRSSALAMNTKYSQSSCKLLISSMKSPFLGRMPNDLYVIDVLLSRYPRTLFNAVILVLRSNVQLSPELVGRVELNTVRGHQVYFPIPFMEYRLHQAVTNNENSPRLTKDSGMFLWFDFRFSSFHVKDYMDARKNLGEILAQNSDQEQASTHHDYDVDLLEMFLQSNCFLTKNWLNILRAVDPDLRLKPVPKLPSSNCEGDIFSQKSLNSSYLQTIGPKSLLASLIIDYHKRRTSQK